MTLSSSTGEPSPFAYTARAQWCAVHGVPGELGAAEKASVALGLKPHRVGRVARDIGRLRPAQQTRGLRSFAIPFLIWASEGGCSFPEPAPVLAVVTGRELALDRPCSMPES